MIFKFMIKFISITSNEAAWTVAINTVYWYYSSN